MTKEISDDIASEAREWLVFLESGEAASNDRNNFEIWFQSDARHRMAFQRVEHIWQDIGGMAHLAELEPRHTDQGSASRRDYAFGFRAWAGMLFQKVFRGSGFAAVGISVIMLSFFLFTPLVPQVQDGHSYATKTAEIQTLTLEDGTEVTLGALSRISVAFSDEERHVVLSGGEAFFSVSSNPGRPFIVEAGDTLVRVIGTKFNVHSGVDRVTVAVAEGEVQVSKFKPNKENNQYEQIGETSQLVAGQQAVSILRGPVQEVRVASASHPGEWRTGRLSYEGAALRDVIADANRYLPNNILIDGEQVGDLLVTASFETRKISSLVDALALVLPIKVKKVSNGNVVLVAKQNN